MKLPVHKVEIELTDLDIENIVRKELLFQYSALNDFPATFVDDEELVDCIARVLKFYGASEEDLQKAKEDRT